MYNGCCALLSPKLPPAPVTTVQDCSSGHEIERIMLLLSVNPTGILAAHINLLLPPPPPRDEGENQRKQSKTCALR